MLKAIIGVDTVDHAESVLRMLRRLQVDPMAVELLNVVDSSLPLIPVGAFSGPELVGEYADALRATGEQTLKSTKDVACSLGMTARATLVYGPPALTLLDYAAENRFDLIGVHATLKGPFGSFVYGSVSRALAISAKPSVLVVKDSVPHAEPIRAVLAVDHSPYCNRCIDKLIAWNPQGIESLCVLTALPTKTSHDEFLIEKLSLPEGRIESWLKEENEKVVEKLKAAGLNAEQRVGLGHPNDVIRSTMYDFGAELAILGAHGHGFIERMLVGSVSLHQVVAEAYSTLLIRA